MQYVEGKELLELITCLDTFSEPEIQHIFLQIMKGIAHIHEKGVSHRDIKPQNILVTENQHIFLLDFNVAGQRKKTEKEFKMMTKTGTLAYTAPEVFKQLYYNEKVDVWSAGIVLY